jgi:hypothetical protein
MGEYVLLTEGHTIMLLLGHGKYRLVYMQHLSKYVAILRL